MAEYVKDITPKERLFEVNMTLTATELRNLRALLAITKADDVRGAGGGITGDIRAKMDDALTSAGIGRAKVCIENTAASEPRRILSVVFKERPGRGV